ncbi:translation initiation factor IF-2 subunit beta [Candidatus Woesearchaeota archaeon]|nr:translation initiation factor IF-2 subunit beta [Candidatus Woesearchaeota archaeon]
MDYASMLKRAKDRMPEVVHEKERFEIPKVRGHIEGVKTVLSNIVQISQYLHRPVEHMLKYLLRELATSGELKKSGLVVLKAKIPASRINAKIRQYAHEFVLCPKCGKPETVMKKDGMFMFLHCQACGEKVQVKAKI